jgi:hypothetical protein
MKMACCKAIVDALQIALHHRMIAIGNVSADNGDATLPTTLQVGMDTRPSRTV